MSESAPQDDPERRREALRYYHGNVPTQFPLGTSSDRIRIPRDDPSEAETQEMHAPEDLPPVVESPTTQPLSSSKQSSLPRTERVVGSFDFGDPPAPERVATSFSFGPAGDDFDFDEEETLGDDRPGPKPIGPAPRAEEVAPSAGVGARLFAAGLLSAAELGGDRGRATPRRLGRYERIESLGKGGTATVYRVRDPEAPERELALKLLSKDLLDPQAQARFEREAQILARVDHPSVVKLYDVGRVEAGSFIVLEQIHGTPLDEGEEELTPTRAAQVLEQLADAVQALHDAGVLHRDIKPDNVVLRLDGVPVLLDFGTAKDLRGETLTRTGDFLGTPEYVAPEEVGLTDRTRLTPAADVYGLGALLYYLLTGRPPFSGSPLLVLEAVQHQDPTWPRDLDPGVPEGIDAICRKAMAKDPTQRYPTAQALRRDLQRFLSGKRVGALPGKSLLPFALVLGALAAIGLGVFVAWLLVGGEGGAR
ncbi:MAG: serine/threonine protein kinase [Planctomycetes bacterium]|nr:serine/threonine protein kinase [Planctomycetota bacterium]